jgi:type IV pilus assembly protein PilC
MGLYSPIVSTKALLPVCYSLANTYHAGIPILRGLELAADQTRDQRLKQVLREMAHAISQDGVTLAQAASAHRKHLPQFFIQLLSAGETGGRLDVMLRDLASYYEDRLRLKRQFIGAMTLPVCYLIIAWFLGSFALGLVFRLDFMDAGGVDFLMAYVHAWLRFQAIALGVFLGVFVASVLLGRAGFLKWIIGWVSNFMWPFKSVTRRFALARFFRSFALLVGAGVNIRDCVLGASATSANPYIQKDLEQALPHILHGETLTQAFATSKYLSPTGREALFVGEQSGNLDGALMKVAQIHQEEATHAMQVMNKILFVLVVLGVACAIGAVVITFWMKYFEALNDLLVMLPHAGI